MRQLLIAAIAATVLISSLTAREQRPSRLDAPPQPTFRSTVEVVHLDVSVLDRDRRPVRGLKPTDFTILEDGKPQQLAVFHAVDVPDPEPATVPWVRDVAPDVRSNEGLQERRLFMLVLDDAVAQSDPFVLQSVRDAARGVIERLGPNDLASVVFTRDNRHSQDYTSDRARLLSAVDKFTLGFRNMADGIPGGVDDLYFMYSVSVLQRAVQVLSSLPDRRKIVVYVGQGIPVDLQVPMATPGLGNSGTSGIMMGTMSLRVQTALEDMFRTAARANVNVYTVDACGLRVMPPPGLTQKCVPGFELDYLKGIAAATGGRAITETNDFGPGLTQIFTENASYYLLGFHSINTRQDGRYRRLEVRVNRPGVEVRTRRGYEAEKASTVAKRRAELETSPLGVALGGVLPKSDLPIQMTAAPIPLPGKRQAAVAIVVGVRQPLRQGQARTVEKVDVQVSAFDVEGRAFGSKRYRADVTIREGASGLADYEILSRLDLKPGRYQLRVAANVGSLSTSGSLYYDVDVPDFNAAAVSLSGMVLTASPAADVAPRDALASLLPIVPTSRRTFESSDQLVGFVRVHQGGKGATVSVPIRARLVDETGNTVMDNRFDLSADQFDKDRSANVRIELSGRRLPAGEYLLTVETAATQPIGRRQLRFRISGMR